MSHRTFSRNVRHAWIVSNTKRKRLNLGIERPIPPGFQRPVGSRATGKYGLGQFYFNRSKATSRGIRGLLRARLRKLRSEGKARGLSDEQLRWLLSSALHLVDETTEPVLMALNAPDRAVEVFPADEHFVACEEDRPTRVVMRYRRPIVLCDPDEELVSAVGD